MKILFQSRSELFDIRGGDTIQIEKTKEAIEKLDRSIKVDISLDINKIDIEKYDIVHLFNLDWICETYPQMLWAKKHNKPVVLSAIHHSHKEIEKYEKLDRYDIRRISNAVIRSQSLRDMSKNVYRSIFVDHKKIEPTISQIKYGIRNTQRDIVETVDEILVQTKKEVVDIKEDFGVSDFKYTKVVNGVDTNAFDNSNKQEFIEYMNTHFDTEVKSGKLILNVGRIEPRKNQLRLIEAFLSLKASHKINDEYKLILIGGMGGKSIEYKYRINNLVKHNPDIFLLGYVEQQIVASAMNLGGIYVQPSWFETSGLVSIEAAISGMPVIASGDRIKEYLGEQMFDCSPESVKSIENAILNAVKSEKDMSIYAEIYKKEYTWENAARQTISVYKDLLHNK